MPGSGTSAYISLVGKSVDLVFYAKPDGAGSCSIDSSLLSVEDSRELGCTSRCTLRRNKR